MRCRQGEEADFCLVELFILFPVGLFHLQRMFQFDACLGDPYGNEGGKYDEKQVERFRSGREIERRSEDELEGSGEYFRRIGDGAFDLEYGFGGLQCDWDEHSAFEFTRVSIWGHDFGVKEQAA